MSIAVWPHGMKVATCIHNFARGSMPCSFLLLLQWHSQGMSEYASQRQRKMDWTDLIWWTQVGLPYCDPIFLLLLSRQKCRAAAAAACAAANWTFHLCIDNNIAGFIGCMREGYSDGVMVINGGASMRRWWMVWLVRCDRLINWSGGW